MNVTYRVLEVLGCKGSSFQVVEQLQLESVYTLLIETYSGIALSIARSVGFVSGLGALP